MSDRVAPSKGAMRAAKALYGATFCGAGIDRQVATIIDRETKSPQMAALLKAIVESCVNDSDSCCICVHQVDGDHRHSEGCVILLAERLLSELEVKP